MKRKFMHLSDQAEAIFALEVYRKYSEDANWELA